QVEESEAPDSFAPLRLVRQGTLDPSGERITALCPEQAFMAGSGPAIYACAAWPLDSGRQGRAVRARRFRAASGCATCECAAALNRAAARGVLAQPEPPSAQPGQAQP